MIRILDVISINQADKWDEIVLSYENNDIYYSREYAHSLQVHGDGEPLLVSYNDSHSRFCYVVMMSDISDIPVFRGRLEQGILYDWETPYGYGGPLSDGALSSESQQRFLTELREYCKEAGVVSQFVRFHPLLGNYDLLPEVIEARYLRDTVYIDTSCEDCIMGNMDAKNRNMVRKAIKSGVTIDVRPVTEYKSFAELYKQTMERDRADEYYLFDDSYFDSLALLEDNARIFYALLEGQPISSSIILFNKKTMHYHLSGSDYEYRSLAAGNFLLYEAAKWGYRRGIRAFHLGGGMEDGDSLFNFKKKFNKKGRLPFYIGRTITDPERNLELLRIRKSVDPGFDVDNGRMIQYRYDS